ncbi:hypothetical protein NL676_019564 [Syzygium grande]|nr:hypothetical protein NL676_019564 [Syzygium grande]
MRTKGLENVEAICLKSEMILDLSWSKITEKWSGWSHIKMAKNLKVLNLTGCRKLYRTPDFSSHRHLAWCHTSSAVSKVQLQKMQKNAEEGNL